MHGQPSPPRLFAVRCPKSRELAETATDTGTPHRPIPFASFQTPVEIPGVANIDFLRMATNARRKALGQSELDPLEFYAFVMPRVRGLRGAGG